MQLGKKIAPPRFLAFTVSFGIGLALLIPTLGKGRGTMAAFDLAALLFLAIVAPLLKSRAEDMRQHAKDNDANRAVLLAISAGQSTKP